MPLWDLGSLSRLKNFSGLFQDVSSKKPEISAVNSDSFTPIDLPLIGHREDENKMQEVQLGSHTVRSHGMTVARTHMHDWVILMLLGLIVVILNVIHPFYRFVGKDMMTDLKYPLKINTVPVWAIPVYDQLGNVVCHGKKSVIKEGHKSFPSGHTSWSFSGLGFLSLYLSGKIKVFDRKGHVAKLCIVFLPLLFASLVGVSRVDDYWHHWQDVFAGGLLGFIVATFCYLQFFPPPYHAQGWGPYAYFQVLEESRSVTQAATIVNGSNVQVTEAWVENQEDETSIHGCMGLSLAHNSGSALEELESGRR
ncbi:putative lipid phosphate phosphatase 3, chloroplastic isoform X4 [Prunus dulcis]|uniref:putative lipid phosphate phosphatase 3, chloroplastic isoform X4 n=1 Tax=Prunus dulcis TaxID=3755 RepID=UPI0014823B1E|nr:putative lipid phosphate phosphatase 3, chloroplastic isoform X4 [Prunus dulcis]